AELNQAGIGAYPDFSGSHRRRSDGVDHAIALGFSVGCSRRARGRRGLSSGEIRADFFPACSPVFGAQQKLRAVIKYMRILWRKYQRRSPSEAVFGVDDISKPARSQGRNILRL